MTTVDVSEIQGAERIGSGFEATVYTVTNRLDGAPIDLVYKKYKDRVKPVSLAGMSAIVKFRRDRLSRERGLLDRYFAWPLATVTSDREVDGVLIPLLGNKYFHTWNDPATSSGRTFLRTLDNLSRDRKLSAAVDMPFYGRNFRLTMCYELAYGVALLHHWEIVYGDMNFNNAAFAEEPGPNIRFMDCDGIRIEGNAAPVGGGQKTMFDLTPPEGGELQTSGTDAFKLAKMIEIILKPMEGEGLKTLGPAGRVLLSRGLGSTPQDRTMAREWVDYFRGTHRSDGGV